MIRGKKRFLLLLALCCLLPACKATKKAAGKSVLPPVASGNAAKAPEDEAPVVTTPSGTFVVVEPTEQETKPLITYRGTTN